MNKNSNTPPTNKRTEIIRLFAILMPTIFVFFFGWLGLVILANKLNIEISAERIFLGVIALMIGVVWAWISIKGRMPFAQKDETLPYILTTAQSPIEKLMRGLFLFVGIVVYVIFAIMPEALVSSFLRIFSFGRFGDTLGMLALLGMLLVFAVVFLISIIKNKLLPHTKPNGESPYASWYLNATINWIQFFVLIILVAFLVYRYMK